MDQISFNYNKSELLPNSYSFLNWLAYFLKDNNNIKVTINGFTDNTGDEQNNLKLSTERAKSVYSYLIEAGISSIRMNYAGYGSKNPISDNSTEDGREKNRRVEIKIIEK